MTRLLNFRIGTRAGTASAGRSPRAAGCHLKSATAIGCASSLAVILSAGPAPASWLGTGPLSLGTAANYALVDLGSGTTLGWNSGPVAGSVLVGDHVTVNTSGGNNGGLANGGVLNYDSSTICSPSPCGSGLQNPPPTMLVSGPTPATSVTGAALASANAVAAYAAGLTATQTFTGTLSSATTVTGDGALNVIDVANIHNAPLTISGGANDLFVFNVSGEFQTNVAMTLQGVTPSQILFNFTGTSGQVLNTSGGNVLYGTFLATDGGQFQFSELDLTGELINTAGKVQLVSGSQIDSASVAPTPEPSALTLLGTALAGLSLAAVRWRRSKEPVACS